MIGWLKGEIQYVGDKYCLLNVSGVGYKVFIKPSEMFEMKKGNQSEFFIAHIVREDSESLFGFKTDQELIVFEQMISVSGVGPKIGMAILSDHSVDRIIQAVFTEEEAVFTSVSGIGPKSARRLILELKGKFDSLSWQPQVSDKALDNEAMEALMALGYDQKSVIGALNNVEDSLNTQDQIKEALKHLNS